MKYLESAPDVLVRMHQESVSTVEEAAARMVRSSIDYCRTILTEPQSELPNSRKVEIPGILSPQSRALLGRLLSDMRMNGFWIKFKSLITCKRRNRFWSLDGHGHLLHCVNLWLEINNARQGPERLEAMTKSKRHEVYRKVSEDIGALAASLKTLEINPPVGFLYSSHELFEMEVKSLLEKGKPVTCMTDLLEELAKIATVKSSDQVILPHPNRDSAATTYFLRKMKEYFNFWLPDFPESGLRSLAWVALDLPEEPSESGTREILKEPSLRRQKRQK